MAVVKCDHNCSKTHNRSSKRENGLRLLNHITMNTNKKEIKDKV